MSAEEFNTLLLSQLECPVCFETCQPPIYMCCNGHIVCAKCQAQLNDCSECRAPGKPTLRCVKLEKIAALTKLPCANEPRGCELSFNMEELAKHLPKCDHGFECYLCTTWKGSARDLNRHVLSNHCAHAWQFGCLPTTSGKSFWTVIPTKKISFDKPYFTLVSYGDDMFWFKQIYSSSTNIFSVTLRIVSYKHEDADRYYYSVEFRPKDKNSEVRLFYQAPVQRVDSDNGAMNFVLPSDITGSLDAGKILFTLKITQKK